MSYFNIIILIVNTVIMCVLLAINHTINFINKLENSHKCID